MSETASTRMMKAARYRSMVETNIHIIVHNKPVNETRHQKKWPLIIMTKEHQVAFGIHTYSHRAVRYNRTRAGRTALWVRPTGATVLSLALAITGRSDSS